MKDLDSFARSISVGQRIASERDQNFRTMVYEKALRRLDTRRIQKRLRQRLFEEDSQRGWQRGRCRRSVGHPMRHEGLSGVFLTARENGLDCGICGRIAN